MAERVDNIGTILPIDVRIPRLPSTSLDTRASRLRIGVTDDVDGVATLDSEFHGKWILYRSSVDKSARQTRIGHEIEWILIGRPYHE